MKHLINLFETKMERLGEDYAILNYEGEEIPCIDYFDECYGVTDERFLSDLEEYKSFLRENLLKSTNICEKELVIAIFCNFCVKVGIVARIQNRLHDWKNEIKELICDVVNLQEKYLTNIVDYIISPKRNDWKRLLDINATSILAKIYMFIPLCYEYSLEARFANVKALDINQYERLWEIYGGLPAEWREYVTGSGEMFNAGENHLDTFNLLPYIDFCPMKDILVEYISIYYSNILQILEIDEDTDSGEVFNEIIQKISGLNHQHDAAFDKAKKQCLMNATMLFEKLQCINNIGENIWMDREEIFDEISYSDMYPVMRNAFLQIPVQVEVRKELFHSHYELYKKNNALEKQSRKKREMMDYYAHSWKHISYPQIVKEIAEELGNSNRILANRLMKAYNSEKTLQRSIQLLQFISSDSEDRINKEFRNGISRSGKDAENTMNLIDVLCESVDLVIFKLLMVESDDSKSIERCREKWDKKKTLENLRYEYNELFLSKESDSHYILEWVSENLLGIELRVDSNWKNVRFKEDSFAVNQFKEILVEVFTNVLLHGENKMFLSFESDAETMIIKEKNRCCDSFEGSKSGLSTMKKVLEYINYDSKFDSLCTKKNDKEFEMYVRFSKKLLIRKGR